MDESRKEEYFAIIEEIENLELAKFKGLKMLRHHAYEHQKLYENIQRSMQRILYLKNKLGELVSKNVEDSQSFVKHLKTDE